MCLHFKSFINDSLLKIELLNEPKNSNAVFHPNFHGVMNKYFPHSCTRGQSERSKISGPFVQTDNSSRRVTKWKESYRENCQQNFFSFLFVHIYTRSFMLDVIWFLLVSPGRFYLTVGNQVIRLKYGESPQTKETLLDIYRFQPTSRSKHLEGKMDQREGPGFDPQWGQSMSFLCGQDNWRCWNVL